MKKLIFFGINYILILGVISQHVDWNLDNLGAQIQASVQSALAPLQNLGSQIESQVHNSLEPVRALEIINKMKRGIGGTTMLYFKPNGKNFVVKNNKMYEVTSSGASKPFRVMKKEDLCYLQISNVAFINNYVCFPQNPQSFVSITSINGHISCESSDGQPASLITVDDYKRLCENVARYVTYKYTPDKNQANHVEIPNKNKFVRCSNKNSVESEICEFEENWIINNQINMSSGRINVVYNDY